jgi:hypothetical protein
MAGKPTKKNGKSKTETKATAQTKPVAEAKSAAPAKSVAQAKSTVTPISQPAAPVANESSEQVGTHAGEAATTQFVAPVAVMEEVRTTVVRLADQEMIEEIRIRAYEFFEQRGRHEGFDREDWARAEAEVLAKYQREKSA